MSGDAISPKLSSKRASRSSHNYTSNHSSAWTGDRQSYRDAGDFKFELGTESDSFEDFDVPLSGSANNSRLNPSFP